MVVMLPGVIHAPLPIPVLFTPLPAFTAPVEDVPEHEVEEVSEPVPPAQTVTPVADGALLLMIIEVVLLQPLISVYVILLLPADTPITRPVELTVATLVVADIQGDDDAGVPDPDN